MKYVAIIKSGVGETELSFTAPTSFAAVQEAIKIYYEDGYESDSYNDTMEVVVVPQRMPNPR